MIGKVGGAGSVSMLGRYFATLACYNAWANRRLYQACAALSEDEYLRERPSVFGSLHATLNHVLVADRIWIARVEGRALPNLRPDQILYADLIGLMVARSAEDAHLRNLMAGMPEAMLDQPLTYRDARGDRRSAPLFLVLGHLFNQQAEHRGEARALLAQTGVSPPPLDLIRFAHEQGAAPAC
jgi:uncharacterized damage-inducible protein DinB